ncbi:MAG: choice-of-anchor L domain-containing protein [Pseudomonadota bacterium]
MFQRLATRSILLAAFGALATSVFAQAANAQATIDDPNADENQLMSRLDGDGVTLSNPGFPAANTSTSPDSFGLFSNGILGAGLEIDAGIVMSTGTVTEALSSNTQAATTEGTDVTYNDPDVTGIDTEANHNVAIFEFDATLDPFVTGLSIDYQFGSDEYPDYVGSRFNDVFAFFVSGPGVVGTQNIAQAPLGGNVRINNINIGTVGCEDDATTQDLTQSAFYVNNGHTTALPTTCQPNPPAGPFPVVTEYNGLTTRLTAESRGLTPGGTYRVKFAIANVVDQQFDSGVFIELISGIYDQDHADAPATYGDPEHNITSGLLLGTMRTADSAGYNDPNAAGDVDDAVSIPSFTQGVVSILSVDVTDSSGLLQAWIDWGADGTFTTSGDQVATNLQDGGAGDLDGTVNGTIVFAANVPATATPGQSFARFRYSSDTNLAPDTGEASDGEVEDYAITISASGGAGTCPAGQVVVPQSGNADLVVQSANNSTEALGVPEAAGTATGNGNSARLTSGQPVLRLDLTDTVPEGSTIAVNLARNNNSANYDIGLSETGLTYTTVATFNSGPNDIAQTLNLTVPAGGARFIEFSRNSGSLWVAGLSYSEICGQGGQLSGSKSVEVYDPTNAGLFALPGTDVIYTITVLNTGGGPVDANSIDLVDVVPGEVELFYGATPEFGGEVVGWSETNTNLFFTPVTDVAFSNSASRPAGFANCNYTPIAGYDPAVTFICINPKGAMNSGDPDPEFSISFRARIR